MLDGGEWPKVIDSIPTATVRDLRDRALIVTLAYSFARIDAALKMKVEDLRPKGSGWQVQLHEKGGKQHVMPCFHALAEALRAYINAAGIAEDRKGWLFRASPGHNVTALTEQPSDQSAAWLMIRRRAAAASMRRSAITLFGRLELLPISATAAHWTTRSRCVFRRGDVTPYRRRKLTPGKREVLEACQPDTRRCRGSTLRADWISNRARYSIAKSNL